MPAALTRTSTPSGAIGGTSCSISSSLSRPPHSRTAIARTQGTYPARGAAKRLPAVMGKGLVGLRHAEDVVLALVRAALLGLRVEQLVGEPLGHRLLAPVAGELDQPADRERAGAGRGHLDRHLVGRAADAAGADLEDGGERLNRLLERWH